MLIYARVCTNPTRDVYYNELNLLPSVYLMFDKFHEIGNNILCFINTGEMRNNFKALITCNSRNTCRNIVAFMSKFGWFHTGWLSLLIDQWYELNGDHYKHKCWQYGWWNWIISYLLKIWHLRRMLLNFLIMILNCGCI